MHKRSFFGSKQQTVLSPLIDLITFRSKISINREVLNQTLLKFLSEIPSLENKEIAKLNKSKTPSETFHRAAPRYKFDSSVLSFLSSDEIKPPADDAFTVILCYQFFAWFYYDQKKGDIEKNFHLFIKCLIKIISTPIQTVVNYAFGEILNYIVNSSSFLFQDSFCSDIIRYFECNLTLESNLFSQFLSIIKKLFSFDKFYLESLNLIDNLVIQKAPIIDVQDNEPLIIALQPHIQSLNPIALHILALLSSNPTTKSSRLGDSFVLIINSIVQNITSSTPTHAINVPPEDENNNIIITEKELLSHDKKDLTFIPDFKFAELFKEPPFDFFDSKKPLYSFMSPRTREICKMISVCIKSSNHDCKTNFAKMFLSHLQITQSTKFEAFSELTATFFTLYKDFGSTELLQDSILPTILKSVIFNPQLHVFLDTPLDSSINTFRESTIDMIHLHCPSEIFDLFKQLKNKAMNYSFIFVEMLVRILNHKNWFPLKMTQSKNSFYITLMEISRQLQSMNMKYTNSPQLNTIIGARNALMIFISNLLDEPITSSSYISSQTFIHGFFWLIFEPTLTSTVLHIICSSISKMKIEYTNNGTFNNFLNFMVAVINSCRNNYKKDSRYEFLAKSLSHELIDSLYQNPFFSIYFLPILPAFLNLLMEFPGKEILSDMLIFLNLYASADLQFELSGFLLKLFYNTIKTVEGTNISKHTENMLFSLLERSVCLQSGFQFFIKIPSALPLILAVFGSSETNSERVVKLIHQLCTFSDYNKIMCHNGEVDFILIQYACSRTKSDRKAVIQYHGCEFELVFSESVFRFYVLPLISMISNLKSDNEDAHCLIDHLTRSQDRDLCFFLTQLVSKSQIIPKPLFSLGTDFVQFTVDGIHTSDFESNGFTVAFMLNIDKEYLKEKDANLTIIKFKDTSSETFSIYLNQFSLYAKQESDSVRTIVNVVKSIPGSTWVSIAITVSFTQEAVVISNFMNNKKLPDSELSPFFFQPGEIKVIVGGTEKGEACQSNQNEWRNQQFALIGGIKLIKGSLTIEDVPRIQGKNSFPILIDSNTIKEPCCQSVYSKPRGDVVSTGLFAKSITDIVINVQPAPPAPPSLVDIFVRRHDCCQLTNYFSHISEFPIDASETFCGYPTMILGLINELFKKDIECQMYFSNNYINIILGHLFKNPSILNANLYFAFYDVLKNITYQPLIKPWFDSFILNTWLWSMCDYKDYFDIIIHYSHVLIVDYRDMFKLNSYFSSLFNQTMLLFALDDEGHHETSIADVPQLLNSTYNEKEILHCQDLFLVFLARIGTINLNEMDLASIIAHVSGWKTKSTLIKLLKMVFDITATLVNVKDYETNCIPCIQSLIQLKDVDIIDHALLILPELVKENKLNYLIKAAFQVMKFENKNEVFNTMLKRLIHSPYQYVFLCILALDLKGDSVMRLGSEFDNIVFDHNVGFNISSKLPSTWFLFPLLLAFHSDDASMEKNCRFIVYLLSKQNKKNFESDCNMIFALTTLISYLTKLWDTKVPLYLVRYLFNINNKEKVACVAQNAIFLALFKTISFEYKSALLDEFKKSKFCDDTEYDQNPPSSSSNDEAMDPLLILNYIASNDIKHLLKVKFVLDLENNENEKFSVKSNVSLLLEYGYNLMLKSKFFSDSEIKVIKYFFSMNQGTANKPAQATSPNLTETTPANNAESPTPTSDLPKSAKSDNTSLDTFNAMAEADEVLDKYRELYQERLNTYILNAQKELQATENFVKQDQIIDIADLSEVNSCVAEKQMKAEYQCHVSNIPNVIGQNENLSRSSMFDQTLCSFFCPFKVKSINRPIRKVEKADFLETLFEHSALLLSFNKKPLPVTFRLNKKFILIFANSKNRTIKLNAITYILPRCQGNGLEFVCANGKSYLLNFQADFPQIQKALNSVKFPNCRFFIHNESMSHSSLQKRWLTDQLSNFDYILRLNIIAGRSFKDRSIYPIFPSILRDYNDITSIKTSFEKFRLSEGKSDIKIDFDKGIKESFNEFDFVRADYFFRPESIDYVPKSWAKDEFDVVFKLRSILESPEMTGIIHKWINNCFKKFSSRFLNIQTFRYDHLPHPSLLNNNNKNKGLTMIKKLDMAQNAPSGTILAASALSSTIFIVLSSSGIAYYLVLNSKESTTPPLIDDSNTIINTNPVEDVDINYSSLLLNPPSSPPSSPSSSAAAAASNAASNLANSITVNVISTFRAQQFFITNNDDDSGNNSILNSLNSNSSLSEDNSNNSTNYSSNNNSNLPSNVTRKSFGSDSVASESDTGFIKRSGSTHVNPIPSMASFDSLGSFSSFNLVSENFPQNASFGFTRGKIAWYLPDDNKAHLIGNEKVINEVAIFPELPFIACCNDDIYFCSDACTVSVITPSQSPYPICSTKSRISALVADEVFHVIIVGTKDGFIHIFRTNDGALVKSIDLSQIGTENSEDTENNENKDDYEKRFKEVRKILITSKWGLIIVSIFGKIKVFNVNGMHIMDIDLAEPILKWFTYSNSQSFDFVVFENVEHKIGFFDPLKKNSVKYFYETMEPLPLISFIPSINSFAFLSESKQITLVPHP